MWFALFLACGVPLPPALPTAVVFGSLHLDVGLIDPLRTWLGGAKPIETEIRDIDTDGFVDLVIEVQADDFTIDPSAFVIHFGAFTTDGMRVARTVDATFAATDPDTDNDGIFDACDACPNIGGDRGPDGCPW